MKRLVFAVALVAMVAACKKADDSQGQMMSDSSAMMADSTKAMGDSTHMAGDTTKH